MEQEKGNLNLHENVSYYAKWKPQVERLFSLLGLTLLLPLLVVIAVSIKCSDWKGTIFFRQKRVGKNGKAYYMYKFRTMYIDAEKQLDNYLTQNELQGPMFKMKNDPRVTPVGRLLRKFSVDELPQLFNVIKGDMALVGPRPPLPREVARYSPYDYQRLAVTPGCTGLWQVSGRNELSFKEMVELDLEYIQQMSLFLDMKILCKTVIVFIIPKGAY